MREHVLGSSWRAGDRVGGYVLAERVGTGAFAEVWLAHDPHDGQEAAVKILKPEPASRDDFQAAVAREARALARLNGHPHVVDVYSYDLEPPVHLVMQFAPGRTLKALLDSEGARGLGAARTVRILDQVALGLEAAHEHRLVHLDVTPRNVRVDHDDGVLLIDFGLVGAVDDEMLASSVIRGEGVGTARYMAPERLERSLVAPAFGFDVYALGCVLYECLTGLPAFDQRSVRKIARAARRAPRPRPGDVDRGLRGFDDLVVDALAVDPADRLPSVSAFRKRLAEAAARTG
jgi:serine/threonine protein kinase